MDWRRGPNQRTRGNDADRFLPRYVQLVRCEVNVAPPGSRRCVGDGIRPGSTGVEREPQPLERPMLHLRRRTAVVLGGQMFGEGSKEHVPVLVACRWRFRFQEHEPCTRRLPSEVLQELGDQPPSAVSASSSVRTGASAPEPSTASSASSWIGASAVCSTPIPMRSTARRGA